MYMSAEPKRVRPLTLLLAVSLAAALLLTSSPALASSVVHGNVYQWSTFDTLNSAQVTVNSVPQQVMVSKNGSYSFSLEKGNYTIVARAGGSGPDALFAQENITIAQEMGDYVIDLILFPSSDYDGLGTLDENVTAIVTSEATDVPTTVPVQPRTWSVVVTGALILMVLAGGAYLLIIKKKAPPVKPEEPVAVEPEEPKAAAAGACRIDGRDAAR